MVAQGGGQLSLRHPGPPGDAALRRALHQLGARQVRQPGVGSFGCDIRGLGGELLAFRRVGPLLGRGARMLFVGQGLARMLGQIALAGVLAGLARLGAPLLISTFRNLGCVAEGVCQSLQESGRDLDDLRA